MSFNQTPSNGRVSLSSRTRFWIFVIIVLTAPLLLYVQIKLGLKPSPEAFRSLVAPWGWWGPAVFTLLLTLRPFILFPSIFLFIAGGLAFGAAWGTVYSVIGATLGACVGFGLARSLGREYVDSKLRGRLGSLVDAEWAPRLVFLLNLIPIVPISAINYGAGLSGISFRLFVLAAFLGVTPRAFSYCFFGSSLLSMGSWHFKLALVFLLILTIVPPLFRRISKKEAPKESAGNPKATSSRERLSVPT